jgi:glycosidase
MSRRGELAAIVIAVAGLAVACATAEEPRPAPVDPGGYAGVGGMAGGGSGGCSSGHGASSGNGASTGQGASSGQGASPGCATGGAAGAGGTGGGPPQCDDSLKRCQHEFDYPAGSETSVELRGDFASDGWVNGVPLTKQGSTWSVSVEVPYAVDVQYKFLIDGTTWVDDPQNPSTIPDGLGGENSLLSGVSCSDYTCVPPVTGSFDWRDAVLYFVFVDRFVNGDPTNDGPAISGVEPAAAYKGGDWAGVRQKIADGYFTDLGVNVLWLSVPMDNPNQAGAGSDGHQYSAYHGYWPSNLDQPEEHMGTMAELSGLVSDAHAAGIRVILDYAMNHVHVSSPVYQQHADWFWPLDNNGTKCVCGEGCAWDGSDAKRCWFRDYLPDFNFQNTDARNFSVSNAIQWVKDTGVDGFRLDAVKHIEDAWVTDLRSRVKSEIEAQSGEHFYMVGETFTGDRDAIKYYVNPSTMLDGQFDFPLRAQVVSSLLIRNEPLTDLDGFLASNDGFYGSGVMSTFVGNHDVPRSIHFAEDNPLWSDPWADGKERAWTNQPGLPSAASAFERLGNAYTLIFTLKGIPLLYYGDEIGMPGGGDPDNRRMMQWSGLSAGQSVLLAHVEKLGAIRNAHPALRKGTRTTLSVTADTLAYRVQYNADTVYVALNRSDSSQSVGSLPSGNLEDQLTGTTLSGPTLSLPARSSLVLLAK